MIEANKIDPADIAGFYTYDKWVSNFVAAMNTPGTYAAVIPGNSPILPMDKHNRNSSIPNNGIWTLWQFAGGVVLILPNKTIIPYGTPARPAGSAISFDSPSQVYSSST
ncbi:hypothetical protein [Candidatus Nanopusillus massiliensis]|uniref:hypothetical protein n=1 Tax=Candidatus Nanopusillus massiliensis TaxID=2897163 RepID=UPI001E532925|nr:hypothetical protein [Candidatus Nanopusillus massiliensis]